MLSFSCYFCFFRRNMFVRGSRDAIEFIFKFKFNYMLLAVSSLLRVSNGRNSLYSKRLQKMAITANLYGCNVHSFHFEISALFLQIFLSWISKRVDSLLSCTSDFLRFFVFCKSAQSFTYAYFQLTNTFPVHVHPNTLQWFIYTTEAH